MTRAPRRPQQRAKANEAENLFCGAWIDCSGNSQNHAEAQGEPGHCKPDRFRKNLAEGADSQDCRDLDGGENVCGYADVERNEEIIALQYSCTPYPFFSGWHVRDIVIGRPSSRYAEANSP